MQSVKPIVVAAAEPIVVTAVEPIVVTVVKSMHSASVVEAVGAVDGVQRLCKQAAVLLYKQT